MQLHRCLQPRPGLCNAQSRSRSRKVIRAANDAKQGSKETEKGPDLGLKAAWVGAELLGDVSAKLKKADDSSTPAPTSSSVSRAAAGSPMTLSEVVASIKDDYAVDYFISGKGEMAAYAPDCLFKDDFASFRGVDRFKKNVANLGALLSEVDLQVASLEPVGDAAVEAQWRFSGVLDLPWRPRLAAAGSTTHVIDTSRGCVVEHIEKWKSDPKEVIARLLRPAASKPTTPWEVFMHSLFVSKDYKVAWYVISRRVTLLAAPAVAAAVATHALTGHGLPAVLGGGVLEGLAGALLVAGLLTELAMIADGNQL